MKVVWQRCIIRRGYIRVLTYLNLKVVSETNLERGVFISDLDAIKQSERNKIDLLIKRGIL
jgi:hypothetical protein